MYRVLIHASDKVKEIKSPTPPGARRKATEWLAGREVRKYTNVIDEADPLGRSDYWFLKGE